MLRMRTSEKRMCAVITVQECCVCAHQKKECVLLLRCKNVAHAHITKKNVCCYYGARMLRMRTSEKRMCVVITVQECYACAHQKKECVLLLRCKNVVHVHIRKLSLFCFWEHFICFKCKVSYLQVSDVLCKTEMESVSLFAEVFRHFFFFSGPFGWGVCFPCLRHLLPPRQPTGKICIAHRFAFGDNKRMFFLCLILLFSPSNFCILRCDSKGVLEV